MSVAPSYHTLPEYSLPDIPRGAEYIDPLENSLAGQHASFYINYHRPLRVAYGIVTSVNVMYYMLLVLL